MVIHMSARAYQRFYCEENIWHLAGAEDLRERDPRVVFISNPRRQVIMWLQRAARELGAPMAWDYHVILLCRAAASAPEARPAGAAHQGAGAGVDGGWEVWDLDTVLPCPCPVARYMGASFAGLRLVPKEYAPRFRVIDGAEYRRLLCSDRSHMRAEEGQFHRPPPPWPCIGEPGAQPNLDRFIDMEAEFAGEVMDLERLLEQFG